MQSDIQLSLTDQLIEPLVPVAARPLAHLLWRLDSRLNELAHAGREPALRQIRLAWWRDALAALDDASTRVPDEPMLRKLATELVPIIGGSGLADLAEAKLVALSADWAVDDVMAAGKQLFALSQRVLGQTGENGDGGSAHALVDLALRLDAEAKRTTLFHAAAAVSVAPQPRPLAVLDHLARAIAMRGGRRQRTLEQLLVLRVGLFGR